jgi:hypothetical protein
MYGYQSKQLLFPYTALIDWILQPVWSVFTARYELNVYIKFKLTLWFLCLAHFHDYKNLEFCTA